MKPFPVQFGSRWRATLLLALGAALNYGDRAAMSSVLPALRGDLGLSDAALGFLGALFLWSYAISSPIAGFLSDRFSRNRTVVFSLFAWSIVMGLTGLAGGFAVLCALRVALGFAESLYLPAAIALIGDHHLVRTRARGINTLIIGISFGVIAGGASAGYIASHWGWRAVFLVLGGGGVALGFIFRSWLPPGPTVRTPRPETPSIATAFRYLIRIPSFHMLLIKVMLAGVAGWVFCAWLPLYFYETFHMQLAEAGFAGNFLPEFSALIGLAAGAWISDMAAARSIRHRMLIEGLAYIFAAPFLLFFLGRGGFSIAAFGLLAFGIFRGLGDANEAPIVCEIVPVRYRSTALGTMNMCATAAGGCGVVIVGTVKKNIELGTIFAACSVLVALAALVLLADFGIFLSRDIERARRDDAAN